MSAKKKPPSNPMSSRSAGERIHAKRPSLSAAAVNSGAPATQRVHVKKEDGTDEKNPIYCKQEVVSEEESIKQTPSGRPSKRRHRPSDDADSEVNMSVKKGYDHGNLQRSPCRTPEPSSANQIFWKQKPSSEVGDIFEAYRHSLKRKADPSTPESQNQGTAKKLHVGSRFFTTEDEAALLETVIAFKEENGHEPVTSSDFDALHTAVKSQLQVDCDMKQIRRKFIHLKQKYSKKFSKENEKRMKESKKKAPDPHFQTVNALARNIWDEWNHGDGVEFGNGEAFSVKGTGKANYAIPKSIAPEALVSSPDGDEALIINFIANEFRYTSHHSVRNKLKNMSSMEKEELQDIWNEFQQKEMEFQTHRLEAAKRIIDRLKALRNTNCSGISSDN